MPGLAGWRLLNFREETHEGSSRTHSKQTLLLTHTPQWQTHIPCELTKRLVLGNIRNNTFSKTAFACLALTSAQSRCFTELPKIVFGHNERGTRNRSLVRRHAVNGRRRGNSGPRSHERTSDRSCGEVDRAPPWADTVAASVTCHFTPLCSVPPAPLTPQECV